jgi:nucleotide-binding universal stress UspA family protein
MAKYRKILVAFDGSKTSKHALRQALKFDPYEQKETIVLTVNPPYVGDLELIGVSNIQDVLRGQREKILSEAGEIAKEEGVSIKTRLEEGEFFKKIIDIAEEEKSDLIVIGRRGITRLERALMGSVTAKVIGHSQINVLVVPRDSIIKWENIVVTTDGSKYSEAAAKEAVALTKFWGEKCVLHAIAVTRKSATQDRIQISNNALKEIQLNAKKENIKVDTLLVKGKPHESIHETIVEYAKEKNADIIVMGSRGRTGIQRLLIGSVTERVIGHTTCPVMVVKK